jgi:hypothetical protein
VGDIIYYFKNEIPLLLLFPYLLDQMEQVYTISYHLGVRCVLTTFLDPKYYKKAFIIFI